MSKTNQPSHICAIDASTNSLAFAFYTHKKLTGYGKINFEGNNIYEKVVDATAKTKALFDYYNLMKTIVIEQSVYMNSPKTLIDLSMVQGAIIGGAGLAGVESVNRIVPIAWQNYLGNKKLSKEEQLHIRSLNPGKSLSWYKSYERDFRKKRTIKLLEIAYDKKIEDYDVADAAGIGHYAINNWQKLS